MRLALTGASGWIGARLREIAADRGIPLVPVRARAGVPLALPPAQAMIHLGGIAHDLDGRVDPAAYQAANAELPLELARDCAQAGYRRFIFVSSAKVIGETTVEPAAETAACRPQGPYARSKYAAEQALAAFAPETRLEVLIVRPPLVYGPGVQANFARLLAGADSALPWPGCGAAVRRSLVFIDNLADALLWLAAAPAAQCVHTGTATIYHVTDGPALSLDEVVGCLRRALGRAQRQLPLPALARTAMLRLPFVGARARRLLASLELDPARLAAAGWQAPVEARAALAQTARAWRTARQSARRQAS